MFDYENIQLKISEQLFNALDFFFEKISFEVQDQGEFLLIVVKLKAGLDSVKFRHESAELVHNAFLDHPELPYNWMVAFMEESEVIASAFSESIESKSYIDS